MEMYEYQCPVCKATHRVPSYWMSFSPEEIYQCPHRNKETGQMCECVDMEFVMEVNGD